MPRNVISVFIIGLLLTCVPGSRARAHTAAQGSTRYFPETGHVVGGRFLEYWQNNGGVAVFGFPLTAEFQEDNRTVQYFERQRFEWHPANPRPYDVLLGRLGDTLLQRAGVDWRSQPTSPGPVQGCRYFALTRHNVCNQQPGTGFLEYWQRHGLEFDGRRGTSFAESLALFGNPLTEPYQYTNSSGDTLQVQWFERARFEWHAANPQTFRVLLGRLGAEAIQSGGSPPAPPTVNRVQINLIALGDNGRSGTKIGCDDSVVPVAIMIEPTPAPLTAALNQLFALKSQFYGQSGLYNALYQSNLRVDRAVVEQGQAVIFLSGELSLGGVCDNPRVEAQIKETARQFATVNDVVVYLNGQRLEDVLSGQ